MAVEKGNKVKIKYTGRLSDGTIFDASKDEHPLEFTVGEGKVIPGFENNIVGMELNEEKKFLVECAEAYGEKDDTMLRRFSKTALPEGMTVDKGMILQLHLPNGGQVPGTVVDQTDAEIVVDLNHPLAGKDLTFEIKVIHIE